MIAGALEEVFAWAEEQHLANPTQLFCASVVQAAVAELRDRFPARISYATKANIHPLMLATLAPLVEEFNVTNVAHLGQVLAAGVPADRINYINPVLTPDHARTIMAAGVRSYVVDDEVGLELLTRLQPGLRLTLRLGPGRGELGRSLVRFGNHPADLRRLAIRAAASGATIQGLSFFVGAQLDQGRAELPYLSALAEMAKLHSELASDGVDVLTVNIGGGFPGARRDFHRRNPEFFPRLAAETRAAIGSDIDILCEPGRYLAEPSMAMLTTVIADRSVTGRRMTHVDASGYGGLFETTFISPGGAALPAVARYGGPTSATQLIGPVMDSFDVIKIDAQLPPLTAGDLLLLPNCGAYSWSYAASCEGVRQPDVVAVPEELQAPLADIWVL